MPGWHAATGEPQRDGRLLNVGMIQEQHPDRARLFLQWQGIDWPVMVDALNRLDVDVVPITLLIDENGTIRRRVTRRDDPAEVVAGFLAEPAPEPSAPSAAPATRDPAIWGDLGRRNAVIDDYEQRLATAAAAGRTSFELGVLYRRRYDEAGDPADFARAVERWGRAIEVDPNQYIWRRRIQQYGPRLEKPYPFYDWVPQARAEIEARGETPVGLLVEPGGAEIARPIRSFDAALPAAGEPDPERKIRLDEGPFVRAHATVVPHAIRPGKSARVHLELRPHGAASHWNNEAGGLTLWIDAPGGWRIDRQRIERPNPAEPVSREPRRIEFEIEAPAEASGTLLLPAYALYYVCRGEQGPCLYRRQDLRIPVPVSP